MGVELKGAGMQNINIVSSGQQIDACSGNSHFAINPASIRTFHKAIFLRIKIYKLIK